MKVCTSCHLCYEDIYSFCATDQSLLVNSPPASPFIAKKYRLDWLIGQGRLGKVFEGTILETDRRVAIKLLLPDLAGRAGDLKQFRAEAYAVAHLNTRIDQQHVARTYDYGTLTDGTPYFVTELIEGRPLNEYLKVKGRLSVSDAIEITRQIAGGLEAAHRAAVIHGDLKLSNIFISRDRHDRIEVKIVEFGFTRMRALLAAHNDYWGRPDRATDTLHYVAPEQRSGRNPNERADVYSLGVVLYELLDGEPIVIGDVPIDEISLAEDLTPLHELRDDIPEALWQLIKQSLDEKPISRPWSAAVFARQLDKIEHPEMAMAVGAAEVEPAVELPLATETASADVPETAPFAAAATAGASMPLSSISEYTFDDVDFENPQLEDTQLEGVQLVDDQLVDDQLEVDQLEDVELSPIPQPVELPSSIRDEVGGVEPIGVLPNEEMAHPVVLLDEETPYLEEEGWELDQVDRVLKAADPANCVVAPSSSISMKRAVYPVSRVLEVTKARLVAPTTLRLSVVLLCSLIAAGAGMILGNRLFSVRSSVTQAKSTNKPARPQGIAAPAQVRTASAALVTSTQQAPTTTQPPPAQAAPTQAAVEAAKQPEQGGNEAVAEKGDEAALQEILERWLVATNERDVESQMSLYTHEVDNFYGRRNASLDSVREHKSQVYERARSIDMRASKPEIKIDENGQKATVRFRKEWVITGKNNSRGRATQELRLVKTDDGWKISGERNVS